MRVGVLRGGEQRSQAITDDDLTAGTIAAIGVPIDFVVTAEQA